MPSKTYAFQFLKNFYQIWLLFIYLFSFHEPYLLLLLFTLINNNTNSIIKIVTFFWRKKKYKCHFQITINSPLLNLPLSQSIKFDCIISDLKNLVNSHKIASQILTFGHYFSVFFVGWSNPGKRTIYVVLGRVEPCDTSLISSGPMWQAIDDESVQIISKYLS